MGERLCRGCENGSEAAAEQVMAEAAACSKTPSCEQRVPYYCWRTKWEVGVVAEIGAGEGGSVWVRKGLEELGTVALFLVGCRETWQLWAGRDGRDPGFRKITLISSVEDVWR